MYYVPARVPSDVECNWFYRNIVLFAPVNTVVQLAVFFYSDLFSYQSVCNTGVFLTVGLSFLFSLCFTIVVCLLKPPPKRLVIIYAVVGFGLSVIGGAIASSIKPRTGCTYASLSTGFGTTGIMILVYALMAFTGWVCCDDTALTEPTVLDAEERMHLQA